MNRRRDHRTLAPEIPSPPEAIGIAGPARPAAVDPPLLAARGIGAARRLALVLACAIALGCAATTEQRDAARKAWESHDQQRARECRGASLNGSCIGGGGP